MAIEVKGTSKPRYRDISGLQAFLGEYPQAAAGLLIHCGNEIKRLDQKIPAIPWTMLTG